MKLAARKAVKKTVAFAFDEELLKRIDVVAKQNGLSRSNCVRQLCERALKAS